MPISWLLLNYGSVPRAGLLSKDLAVMCFSGVTSGHEFVESFCTEKLWSVMFLLKERTCDSLCLFQAAHSQARSPIP